MSQDVGDARKGLLDRSFQTLKEQMQIPCWNKNQCPTMKKFGPATDNARVPCILTIMNAHKDMTKRIENWKELTPRDVFQYNNPDTKVEEGHSASKIRETGKKLRRHRLTDREGCLHIVVKCEDCEVELAVIRAMDTIESLYQDIQKLVVHDKLLPLKYDNVSKLKPELPDDAAKVCELTHSDTVNACVKKLQSPEVLESIRRSLAEGKLKEILKKKGDKAKEDYGDPKKTYIRIGLGFRDFGEFPSQPVLELWPRTYSSPIHQHGGCAGSIRVVHGKLACKFYESVLSETPMKFQKGDCGLHELDPQPQEVLALKAGDTTWLNRQSWFVHAVECSNDASIEPPDFTLSIHFYKSCTDEFAFVVDGAHGKKVKKAQPKNDLFWNWKNGNDSKDGLEKGHTHYLEHYEDEKGEKILVPDFEKEVISAGAKQDAAVSGSTAALAQEDAAQAEADKAKAKECSTQSRIGNERNTSCGDGLGEVLPAAGSNSILQAAVDGSANDVQHLLRTQPRAVASMNGSDLTALHYAAYHGRVEICAVLLAARAELDAMSDSGDTPLHLAACNCRVEVVKLLVEAKASLTVKDENAGQTPLDKARSQRHQEVVTILANAENAAQAKADEAEAEGCHNSILTAAANGTVGAVRHLLRTLPGAAAATDDDGFTALHRAAHRSAQLGRAEMCRVLLAAGAAVDARERYGRTPLHWAADDGHVEVVKLLLEAKASVTVKNRNRETPLHFAAQYGHVEAVKLLLEAKASVTVKINRGQTPLHLAAYNGQVEVVKLLLEAKASVAVKDDNGQTPLDLARNRRHHEVVTILENAA